MAKGQMRKNKKQKGGPAPSPFAAGQGQPGSNPYGKKG